MKKKKDKELKRVRRLKCDGARDFASVVTAAPPTLSEPFLAIGKHNQAARFLTRVCYTVAMKCAAVQINITRR